MSKTTLRRDAPALGALIVALALAAPGWSETAHDAPADAGHAAEAPADAGHGAADAGHDAPAGDHAADAPADAGHGAADTGHGAADTGHGAADTGYAAPEGAADLNQVVATVNGTAITVGHMMVAKAALPQQYQTIPDDQLWDGLLEQLVQQEVLAQSPDAHETPLVGLSMDNEKRSLLAAVAITDVARRAVTEAKVLEIYQRDYVDADRGKEYNASHILLDSEHEAQLVLDEVKGGADFATVARDKSTGPSGPNGGELGWFGEGMMVEPFQNAVEAMQPGDIVGPVQTQFGWHVIKLNDTRNAQAPLLDAVRPEIAQKVQQEAVEAHIDGLMRQNQITRTAQDAIDPSVLSRTDLLEN